MIAFTVLALVFGTPLSTAQAAPFGLDCIGVPDRGNWGPEIYASASTSLLPIAQPQYGPEPRAGMNKKTVARNYTLYELTNGRGLLWSTYKKDAEGDEKCSIMDVAGNWMAQMTFEFSKALAGYSLAIQDLAMNTAPFQDLYQDKDGPANSLVAKLYSTLWAPLGVLMITLCGAWVVVHARTKSRSKVWQGVGGMFVSLFVSALLLQGSWYTTVTSEADEAINGFSSAMTELMLPENPATNTADPCWLAEGVPNRAKRISSCTMYKAMLLTPWAAGQFGQNANSVIDSGWKGDAASGWDVDDCSQGYRCTDIRTAQVMAQTFTRADNLESLDEKGDMFEKVAKQMATDERKSRFNDWRGSNPSSRMQVALASAVSNMILAPAIDFVALFKLFWEGFILILIIVLPIVGAVAAFPPALFMAREWGNAFTIAFVLKGAAWAALTLLMAIYTMILSSNASLGVQVLMIIMVGFGLWHFTSKTMNGAKRAADQAFEAQAAYSDVTGRAGGQARTQARQAARRGVNRVIGSRMPSPRRSRGPSRPSTSGPGNGRTVPRRTGGTTAPNRRSTPNSPGPSPASGRTATNTGGTTGSAGSVRRPSPTTGPVTGGGSAPPPRARARSGRPGPEPVAIGPVPVPMSPAPTGPGPAAPAARVPVTPVPLRARARSLPPDTEGSPRRPASPRPPAPRPED
ncbi:hypothetical protein [Streptomyces niveus]|uniref:hypothetical protein n=1 Tax=Streptomyces niveus TaxID=193462 RepID=UPI0034211C0B